MAHFRRWTPRIALQIEYSLMERQWGIIDAVAAMHRSATQTPLPWRLRG
jgi:hypothetical protein